MSYELPRGIAVFFDNRLELANLALAFGLTFDVALNSPLVEGIASSARTNGEANLLPRFCIVKIDTPATEDVFPLGSLSQTPRSRSPGERDYF